MVIERKMVKMYAFVVTEFILTIKSSCSSDKKIILCWLSRYRNRVEMDRKVESNGMSSEFCHAKMRFIIFLPDMPVCMRSTVGWALSSLSFSQPVSQSVSHRVGFAVLDFILRQVNDFVVLKFFFLRVPWCHYCWRAVNTKYISLSLDRVFAFVVHFLLKIQINSTRQVTTTKLDTRIVYALLITLINAFETCISQLQIVRTLLDESKIE